MIQTKGGGYEGEGKGGAEVSLLTPCATDDRICVMASCYSRVFFACTSSHSLILCASPIFMSVAKALMMTVGEEASETVCFSDGSVL